MFVKKLNIVKEIDEKQLPYFEDKGYSRIDDSGEIIPSEKKERNGKQTAKIAELEKELAERDARIAELTAALEIARKQ